MLWPNIYINNKHSPNNSGPNISGPTSVSGPDSGTSVSALDLLTQLDPDALSLIQV